MPNEFTILVVDFIEDQKNKDILPEVVYGDTHYNGSENIERAEKVGVELKGPVAPVSGNKIGSNNKDFTATPDGKVATCPTGHNASNTRQWKDKRVVAIFSKGTCNSCEQNNVCIPEKNGKIVVIRPESTLLKARRALMETEEYKKEMYRRNGIEGTLSGLVRGQGMRKNRHRGKRKLQLQLKFIGTAANILRLHRKRQIEFSKAS